MRNMIKKKYACILLLLLAIGSGCSDWLDVRPRNEMKEVICMLMKKGLRVL